MQEKDGVRGTIIKAFNRLVLSRRQLKPPVADVLAEANVARSTFYEHFDSRDSVLIEAFEAPLSIIADAASGTGSIERLANILDHLRENRRGAVEFLTGPLAPRIIRSLGALIETRIGAGQSSLHIADQQIGFIRLWLQNETRYASPELAKLMIASAEAQRNTML